MKELYADDQETVAGVRDLNLVTRNDGMITPFTNDLMRLEQMEVEGAQDDTHRHQPASPPPSESRKIVVPQDTYHANHFRLLSVSFCSFCSGRLLLA